VWVSACGVRYPVAEVDLEREERDGPVSASCPLWDRVLQSELDELAGGVRVGEAALERDASLPARVADRFPNRGCGGDPLALDHLLAAVLVDERDCDR
jgi:hypothetical protein